MRKSVCFLMMMLLLLSVAVAGQAQGAVAKPRWAFDATIDAMVLVEEAEPAREECDHVYRMFENPYRTEYAQIDGTHHEKRVYFDIICDKCGSRADAFIAEEREAHTMSACGDAHVEGENLHTYSQSCVQCAYINGFTIGCPGAEAGDCPAPYFGVEENE